ncbi:hypothetical protein EDB81DRAFT_768859 [Dactylonectria macrodidyma]|uniref:Uncharacterized protein n=1 Tax=Dactylonectria macrodidyma TaxID=307937 RepID=A0A9P9D103_9HYPO|nr:hypothetical protein EDB81DRAFT_768859 [Dactylonectria macrodidyma]
MLGFGATGAPEDLEYCTFTNVAADIKELAASIVGAGQVILSGDDWGGAVSIIIRYQNWNNSLKDTSTAAVTSSLVEAAPFSRSLAGISSVPDGWSAARIESKSKYTLTPTTRKIIDSVKKFKPAARQRAVGTQQVGCHYSNSLFDRGL